VAIACLSTLPRVAEAGWTVVSLHRNDVEASYANAVHGGRQAGFVIVGGRYRACVWSGSAASFLDIAPAGQPVVHSQANHIEGGRVVGEAYIFDGVYGTNRATMWDLSSGSRIDLHPANALSSAAYRTDGGQQVGQCNGYACYWTGSSDSYVNLGPAIANASVAYGVSNGRQAGYVNIGDTWHASVWSGTADSWVDLHPTAVHHSWALGISQNQQAGFVEINSTLHASTWRGSAATWIDLNPPNAAYSIAFALSLGMQVGLADVGGTWHASLWKGTVQSWVDLHQFLPPTFTYSEARDIWRDGATIYVVGSGFNTVTETDEALMWIYKPGPN
jgi:hypothetical protein